MKFEESEKLTVVHDEGDSVERREVVLGDSNN